MNYELADLVQQKDGWQRVVGFVTHYVKHPGLQLYCCWHYYLQVVVVVFAFVAAAVYWLKKPSSQEVPPGAGLVKDFAQRLSHKETNRYLGYAVQHSDVL